MSIADRLRALQRQTGQRVAIATTSTGVGATLRQLLRTRERLTHRTLSPPAGTEIGKGLCLVESTMKSSVAAYLTMPWGEADPVARERVVCFDTETTGLAGGVGTKAFMIGMAQWQDDTLQLRQLYLTALAGEEQMLSMFASWLPPDAVFVSYNGRSYDAPLLKGRYRLHRQQHPFEERRHVDLLYPARRAYRDVLPNCRLQTVERHVLGIVREDDLPGSEAPSAWLAFLRGQSEQPLGRVVEHNRQDIVSLATLLEWLSRTTPDG
jgi:uncharacterized protein YprB with RNaseH-like and TPR domain